MHIEHFQKELLDWFEKNKRDCPWRKNKDPYRIWISEIMLQQTQVKTVIPYYQKFIRKFSTLQILAKAKEKEVLRFWSGLGYYRRAKQLHQTAKQLGQKQWVMPKNAKQWETLPGIGPYTAAAIASIAHDEAVAVVDGNVIRVIARLFALPGHGKDPHLISRVTQEANSLLPSSTPGDFNQAMMELGATCCKSKNPNCELCPVQTHCAAYKQGEPSRFPEISPRKKTVFIHRIVLILKNQEKIFLQRRSQKQRWVSGLYGPPEYWLKEKEKTEEILAPLLEKHKLPKISHWKNKGNTKHTITHHQITTHRFAIEMDQTHMPLKKGQFYSPQAISKLPMASLDKKVFEN